MFCYQAAAFRRSRAGIASVITFGSPVDIHRTVPSVGDDVAERWSSALRAARSSCRSTRIEGLPGFLTSTGFKLLSARARRSRSSSTSCSKLHDREALEKREAERLFLARRGLRGLAGAGAAQVHRRADRRQPDDVGRLRDRRPHGHARRHHVPDPVLRRRAATRWARPPSVRGIRAAAPQVDEMYEVAGRAGHFGLVVGSTALTVTWPTRRRVDALARGRRRAAAHALDVRGDGRSRSVRGRSSSTTTIDDDEDDRRRDGVRLELARQDLVARPRAPRVERVGERRATSATTSTTLRWQVPRLHRAAQPRSDDTADLARPIARRAGASAIGDRTFFLWRGRAFTYADANRRVDAVVRGLIACGDRSRADASA